MIEEPGVGAKMQEASGLSVCEWPRQMWADAEVMLGDYGDHPKGLQDAYLGVLDLANTLPREARFLEVGTREGGTALLWLHAIARSREPERWLWTCDPYGDKQYMDRTDVDFLEYGERKYRKAMRVLGAEAEEHGLNWHHWRMTSQDFAQLWAGKWFRWYEDGVFVTRPRYGFVYLDGDHRPDVVAEELREFAPLLVDGGVIVIDDSSYWNVGQTRRDSVKGLIEQVRGVGEDDGERIWLTKDALVQVGLA